MKSRMSMLLNFVRQHSQTDTYDQDAENQASKEILNQIIGNKMEIELIGRWIWCFNCFANKDRLKELRYKFAPKKKAWTWHYGEYSRFHKGETSIDDIRAKYGSQKVTRADSILLMESPSRLNLTDFQPGTKVA